MIWSNNSIWLTWIRIILDYESNINEQHGSKSSEKISSITKEINQGKTKCVASTRKSSHCLIYFELIDLISHTDSNVHRWALIFISISINIQEETHKEEEEEECERITIFHLLLCWTFFW